MPWHAYYRTGTGELVSVGSDDAPPARGVARVLISAPPTRNDVWNPSTHVFEDRTIEVEAEREAIRASEAEYRAALEAVRQHEASR